MRRNFFKLSASECNFKYGTTFFVIFIVAVTLLFPFDGFSQVNPPPQNALGQVKLEGFIRKNFVRLIFKIDGINNFTADLKGDILEVNLGKPVTADLSKVSTQLGNYITSAEVNSDKTLIILKLKRSDLKLRRFVGDKFVGIDLILPLGEVAVRQNVYGFVATKENISPVARNTESVKAEQPVSKTEEVKKDESDKIGTVKDASSITTNTDSKIEDKKAADQKTIDTDIENKTAENEEVVLAATPEQKTEGIDTYRERIKNGIKLIFPLQRQTAATIFSRNNYIWLVFDGIFDLKFDTVKGIKYISDIKQLKTNSHSVIRIKINDEFTLARRTSEAILLNIRGYKENNNWALEIQEDDPQIENEGVVANAITITPVLENQKASVFIYTSNPGTPLEIKDPEAGDDLIIIPLSDDETGVDQRRSFVEFALPSTAQGIVIRKIADGLLYNILNDRLQIYKEGDLNTSPELNKELSDNSLSDAEKKTKRSKKQILPSETVFPFNFVTGIEKNDSSGKIPDFTDLRQKLFAEMNTTEKEKRSEKRLEIAKFFFAHRLFSEALGALNEIKSLDPLFAAMQEVDIIIAACNYMQGHYRDADTQFAQLAEESSGTEMYDELKLWQWASHFQATRGDRGKADEKMPVDYIASYDKYMQKYPKDLRYSFGLLAVEEMLENKDIETGKTILEIISYEDIPSEYINHTKFIKGQIAELNGNNDEAIKIWGEIADDVEDRYNRARAIFAVTKNKLIFGKIDVEEAVRTFNELGVVWRGDSFELDLLKLIGQLYIKKREYAKGLRAWQTLVGNFPNTKEALYISGKMKALFIELFDGGEAYKLPPLDALALFYEFRSLTPVGEKGDKIIQQLADHFIKADLLDNAAALITHQVRFRAVGVEKNLLVLKLSGLRLQNKQPELAIEAFDLADPSAINEEFSLGSKYLRGRAYLTLNQYDKIFALLRDDFSKNAQDIRLEIFWRERNWFGIMNIVESRFAEMRETPSLPLTKRQITDLTKLAVAYASQEETGKLDNLRKEFANRIENREVQNILGFVSSDIKYIDYKRFEETVQLDNMETFLKDYAFWPGKDWKNVAVVLSGRMESYKRDEPPLTIKEKQDVVSLAIAYAMQSQDQEMVKSLGQLARDFRNVAIDRDTIEVFKILDDKFIGKNEDAVFDAKIPLSNIQSFMEKYKSAKTISELNLMVR